MIKVKSKKGQKPAFVWVLLDEGGTFRAVCYAAENTDKALNPMFLTKAMQAARSAFIQSLNKGKLPTVLVDLSGRPLTLN